MLVAQTGLVLTEQTVIAAIAAAGGLLAALVTAFGSVFVVLAGRARRAAGAAHEAAEKAAHEMVPNSGSSLRDAVDRTERLASTLVATTATLATNQDLQAMQMAALDRRLSQHIEQSSAIVEAYTSKE